MHRILTEKELSITMRVADIVVGTTVDGPGFRTSIYFAGCKHQCPDCHNKQTWPLDAGHSMTIAEILNTVKQNGFNVTFSGGDPLLQAEKLTILAEAIATSGFDIWCYTGFTYEQIQTQPLLRKALQFIDVLVDGPFIKSLHDTELLFRGSSNQRLIDLKKSTPTSIVEWKSDF